MEVLARKEAEICPAQREHKVVEYARNGRNSISAGVCVICEKVYSQQGNSQKPNSWNMLIFEWSDETLCTKTYGDKKKYFFW